MPQIETTYRSIAAAPRAAGSRFASARPAPAPEFLSQLLSDRETLAAQRAMRAATPLEVLRTYDAGGRLRLRRMPPGYRTDLLA